MINLRAQSVSENEYGAEFFGGNILADRDRIGEDGTYDEAAERLGVTQIRYPGGSLTENYFDMSNPDADTAINETTGQSVELLPYTEFMNYAEDNDIAVSIVLPTRHYLTDNRDENGNRFAQIDEDELRGFIQDTLDGQYGAPTITSFEIGNEYWGSGRMTTLEYARLSSEMAEILDEEIHNHPNADSFGDLQILVQNGQNYGHANLSSDYNHLTTGEEQLAAVEEDYGLELDQSFIFGNGDLAWARIANEIMVSEFDTASEIEAVDGLAVHIYSRGENNPTSREYDLNIIDRTWDNHFEDLEISVTEWNLKSNRNIWDPEETYGLKQAHEILNMSEVFIDRGVDEGFIWPLQQNNLTNLAGNEGGDGELTIPGQMFAWMSESLPETQMVDFSAGDSEHEVRAEGTSVHGFYDQDEFVTFIASTSGAPVQSNVNFSQVVDNPGQLQIEILGIADGENPSSPEATATVRTVNAAEVFNDGVLSLDLNPYEIARVVMIEPDYAPPFEDLMDLRSVPDPGDVPDTSPAAPGPEPEPLNQIIPTIDDTEDDYEGESENGEGGAFDDTGGADVGLGMSIASFLPLVALMGGF